MSAPELALAREQVARLEADVVDARETEQRRRIARQLVELALQAARQRVRNLEAAS